MSWEKTELVNDEKISAQTPVIVSASRATDVPAFYSDWFVERWKAGYVKWKNPFSGFPLYVSFKKTRAVVFWSKNPKPMFKHFDFLGEHVKNYYFQFTFNDYDKEGFESNVPKAEARFQTFRELADRIGKEKIIWRFDPLMLTEKIDVGELLRRVERIGDEIHSFTRKLVFSPADILIYRKVANNLRKEKIDFVEFTDKTLKEFAEGLGKLNQKWKLELATCAEKLDLSEFGIRHNKCVDDDLMIELFSHDSELMQFLGYGQGLFGDRSAVSKKLKDKGQRKACGCVMSKDIGEYNTCPHGCVYCYANTSKETALKNYRAHTKNPNRETIN